ncbi:MAG: phage tail tape measure protein [Bacillota bacterium]|nr:phage tail tape measure protein [Bacillota bacterium]
MGFDIESSAAMLGKFEKEGVNTELVLGGLRIALGKMAKEGIKDTGEALTEVSKRIKEAGSTGEANAIALELFGTRIGPDMAAAIREGRFELTDLIDSLKNSKESINGVAFETMTYTEQLQLMKNKLAVALESLGSSFMQALNNVMPALSAFADKISLLINHFNDLSGGVKTAIAVLLGIAAAIGPVLMLVGTLSTALSAGIGVLAAMLSPIGLITAAVIALGATLLYLWNTNDAFKNALITDWLAIKETLEPVLNSINAVASSVFAEFWDSLKLLFNQVKPLWEELKQLFMSLGEVTSELWQLLEPVFVMLGMAVAGLLGIETGVINGIIQAFSPLIDAVINAANIIVANLGLVITLLNGDWAAA